MKFTQLLQRISSKEISRTIEENCAIKLNMKSQTQIDHQPRVICLTDNLNLNSPRYHQEVNKKHSLILKLKKIKCKIKKAQYQNTLIHARKYPQINRCYMKVEKPQF